jgi:stage II sporulation protein D
MTERSPRPSWLAFALAVGLACLALSAAPPAAAADPVRVLVVEGRPRLTIGSSGGLTVTDASGRQVLGLRGHRGTLRLAPHKSGILLRETGRVVPSLVAWAADGAILEVDGQHFRGRLEIVAQNGQLLVVNTVDLEEYLQGVVKDEIPPGWPAEASKAMAVAARTYAVYQRGRNPAALFHLRATTASQVYGGARNEDLRTTWAVQATRGQILAFQGQPIPAFYHSCSGGATEDATDYFGLEYDLIVGVKDDFSLGCPYAFWVERLTVAQVEQALARTGHAIGRLVAIQDLIRSRTGRILRLAVQHTRGTLILEGRRFREAVGNEVLRSTDFEVRADGTGFTFVGRGSGHGVGMSQWGAKEMADLAYQHQDILKFYYPLATIGTLSQR